MNKQPAILFLCAALATGAYAQGTPTGPQSGIKESTDPARAEAVLRAASRIQERAARDPQASKSALLERAETAGGLAYLSGGISVEDRVTMHAERDRYNLWVATVAKPSGAYLAGAQLRVVDLKSKAAVLERPMEGPWLMVSLPAGQYQVEARFKADGADKFQTLSEQVSVAPRGLRQAVLRFDSKAEVAPEMQSPFDGNPFGAPAKSR